MKQGAIFFLITFAVIPLRAQHLSGDDIIQKVNEILSPESSHGMSQMTITTTSGDKRTFVMESWSKNKGEKNLVRYLEPLRVKDQAVLMLNNADDIWMYFPRTQRVRKLATHAKKQKMQGSDFSYEDMGSGDAFIREFAARRLKDDTIEGHDCYCVELTRKADGDMSYSRLLLWIVKENYVPILIEYYDENDPNRLVKRLKQSDIVEINGIPTARKAVMTNEDDNSQTSMEITEIEYNIDLSDDLFTERGMRQ